MAEITKEEIASAIVNDRVILADTVRVKSENGMWAKPLQEQTALVNLESNIVGGASEDINSFAEVENKINDRYTKAEVDDKTDMTRLRTHILPDQANTDLGSPSKRFRSLYVDEAYLSTNTLYIGDTPVMGTDADTIVIKADLDQSVLIKTTGTGTTGIQSEDEVQINTVGTNADVKVQATGLNSKVRLAGSGGIELSSPTTVQNDFTVSGNVTFSGNVTANGSQFLVNATTVTTKDNIILLNQGELGSGVTSGKSGIQVDRGDFADYQLIFDETTDKFVVGSIGGIYETLATREYVATEFTNYTIPTASNTTLGGIKIGAGLTINNGVVSVDAGGTADAVEWTGVLNKPTTISGYGITDSYTKAEVESKIVELSPPTDISMKADTGYVNDQLLLKVDKVAGKGLSTEDYTTVEKTKLSGIANNANNYVHPSNHAASMITTIDEFNNSNSTNVQDVLDDLDTAIDVQKGRIDAILTSSTADADTFAEIVTLINSVDTTNDNAFAGYVLTNDTRSTTIETNVTNLTNNKVDKVAGKQLSTEDYTTAEKTKLSGIAAGAQVNVPTNLSLGTATTTTIPLNSSTGTDVVLPAATTTTAGLITSADKTKLDGIATGANNYVLPNASSIEIGGVKVSATAQTVVANAVTATASKTYAVQIDASNNALVNIPWTDTIYSHPTTDGNLHVPATGTTNNGKVLMAGATAGSLTWSTLPSATTTTPGYMSAADKTKLDGIANTANNYVHPSTHDAAIITVTDTFNNSNGTTVQVVLDDLDNAIDREKGRIDAILSASTADKDSFAEIVTLINSVDTTNDNAFAGYVLTNDTRSTSIETNVTNLTNNKVDKTSNQTLHNTDALRVSGKTISLYKGDGTFETIDTQDTVYTHPTSTVKAGTYSKITVDNNGHITAGLVPTMEDIPDATFKRSVRCTTTANLAATYANNVLTMSAVGVTVLDGITIALNDRILVKDQTTSNQNGIYKVTTLGTASVATVLTRTADADTASKISSALVAVDSGTASGGKLFDNDFKTTDTLGNTPMKWNANLDDGTLTYATSTIIGTIKYNGITAAGGVFDGGTTTPTANNRLNYGGYFYPTFLNLTGSADTATASSHVFVETGSDGFVRPKTLANFKTEMFASPTLVTPNIGVATGTSFNSLTGLSSTLPVVAGTATVGTATTAARADHVHPAQTSISGNAATATNVAWTGITGLPQTINGYGITDAYTKLETDTAISTALSFIDCGSIV